MKSNDSHTMTIPVTSDQIVSGNDAGMTPATLAPGQSVMYQLTKDAQRDYEYKKSANQAITLMCGSTSMMPNVDVDRHDNHLTVKIRNTDHCPSNDQPWNAKATLFFDKKKGSTAPAPYAAGLDPVVTNSGGGNGMGDNWNPPL